MFSICSRAFLLCILIRLRWPFNFQNLEEGEAEETDISNTHRQLQDRFRSIWCSFNVYRVSFTVKAEVCFTGRNAGNVLSLKHPHVASASAVKDAGIDYVLILPLIMT